MVFVQIETAGALDAVSTRSRAEKGVDVLFVGPNDLSQALGVPGRYDDPRYRDALERVGAAARDERQGRRASCCARRDQIPALAARATASSRRATAALFAQSATAWRAVARAGLTGHALPLRRLPARPAPAAPDDAGARQALPPARPPVRRRRRGGAALDEVPAGPRHDRPRHRSRRSSARHLQKSEIVEDRGGQLAALRGRASGASDDRRSRRSSRRCRRPGAGYHAVPRAGAGGELLPETRGVRVRRQPERDRRRPHDRQRRAARRGNDLAPAGGLRGPRGGASDLLRDGARDRHLAFDDPVRRGPVHARQEGRPRDGRAHPVEVPEGLDRRPALRRRRRARARSPRSRRRRSARSTPTRRPAWRSRASSSSTARTRTSRSS